MAKLTTEQLIKLFELKENDAIPEFCSVSQYDNFTLAVGNDRRAPQYMLDFINEVETSGLKAVKNKLKKQEKPLTGGAMVTPKPEKIEHTCFVVTSAQNNTDVHTSFFKALKSYCQLNNAKLIIGQYTYNKNGFQNDQVADSGLYYAPELKSYLTESHVKLSKGLEFFGNINILPTAKNPLTGFEGLTKNDYILPHAKIALESYCTAKNKTAKIGYTTGTVTLKNYVQKKAGQTAERAHCYGALIVEVSSEGLHFVRQVQTDESGIFQDLKTVYYPDGTTEKGKISAINWGDIHAEKSDISVLESCYAMLDYFKPKNQLFHDLLDFTARNHHNRKSGHFLAAMHYSEADSVLDNLNEAANILKGFNRNYSQSYVVESNHDLALQSWLDSNDYNFKLDPLNALTYLNLQTYIYENLQAGVTLDNLNLLEYATSKFIGRKSFAAYLKTDESLLIEGIEMGVHGHVGDSGSRGTPQQLQKRGEKLNTGHTHSASIKGLVYTAGVTGSLDMGYNKGGSSWSHSHIVTYSTGFRTIITMAGKDWRFKG